MQSKAYVVADGSSSLKISKIAEENKWFVVRTGLVFQGIINGGDIVPSHHDLSSFSIIGTDKEAIKIEICERIDNMFKVLKMNGEI